MAWKELKEEEYRQYFDALSKKLGENKAEIEVMAVGVMEQEQTAWVPFWGISYDPPEKMISIISEYIDHHIKKPKEVRIHETDAGVTAIEIIAGDGFKHVLKLKNPVRP